MFCVLSAPQKAPRKCAMDSSPARGLCITEGQAGKCDPNGRWFLHWWWDILGDIMGTLWIMDIINYNMVISKASRVSVYRSLTRGTYTYPSGRACKTYVKLIYETYTFTLVESMWCVCEAYVQRHINVFWDWIALCLCFIYVFVCDFMFFLCYVEKK